MVSYKEVLDRLIGYGELRDYKKILYIPWCVNEPWLNFLDGYVNQTEPSYSEVGFAYMLTGDSPVSNSDPYATEPTTADDWVTNLVAHLMMLIPERSYLEGISTDHLNDRPWVMWPDTPYAHLMILVVAR